MEEGLLSKERREEEEEEWERRRWVGAVTRWGSELKEEGRRMGYVAAPMVAVTLSQYLVQVISSMMVGHLGELALSSSAIATSLTGVTGFSLMVSPLPSLLFSTSFLLFILFLNIWG